MGGSRAHWYSLEVVSSEADVGEHPVAVGVEMQEGPGAAVEDPGGALREATEGPQVVQEGREALLILSRGMSHRWPTVPKRSDGGSRAAPGGTGGAGGLPVPHQL